MQTAARLKSRNLFGENKNNGSVSPRQNLLGFYMQSVSLFKPLKLSEIKELARRGRENKDVEAHKKLAERFLPLVIKVANKYRKKGVPVPYADLIQEGNVGLMEATKRFDERRGVKFSTFAIWWIEAMILKAISESSSQIRLPNNKWTILLKVINASDKFFAKFGYKPTTEQIAQMIQVEVEKVEIVLKYRNMKISHLEDDISCNDGNRPFAEVVADTKQTPEQELEAHWLEEEILKVLADMRNLKLISERDAEIFKMRLEIGGYFRRHKLKEIGRRFGITRERVRQLEKKIKPKIAAILIDRGIVAANGKFQPPT